MALNLLSLSRAKISSGNFINHLKTNLQKHFIHNQKLLKKEMASLASETELENNQTGSKLTVHQLIARANALAQEAKKAPNYKLLAPPVRKGMTVLDKNAFDMDLQIPAISIPHDVNYLVFKTTIQILKPFYLKIKKIKALQHVESTDEAFKNRLEKIFLNPELIHENFPRIAKELELDDEIINSFHFTPMRVTYENWSLDQLMESILPDETEKLSSFSQMGHLIHVNLRDHLFPYKQVIGEILLDKSSHGKTVVNKVNSIENEYRNFSMEFLAGEPNTIISLKENGSSFEFDFAHVYWNPRLSTEHERIKLKLKKGDVLYDVFAGVGPFAIPAAKKNVKVLANDLNPHSVKWLNHNATLNKVEKLIRVFNKDGRDFIQQDIAEDLNIRLGSKDVELKETIFHVTMNLPAMAVQFLDAFGGILKETDIPRDFQLHVHVYCFIKGTEGKMYKKQAIELVEENLGIKISNEGGFLLESKFVRDVSNLKEMWRISFNCPHYLLTTPQSDSIKSKKMKMSE